MNFIQLASGLVFIIALALGWQITRPLQIPEDRIYTLEIGHNASDLAKTLAKDGILSETRSLVWTAYLGGFDRRLKAGEYRFEPNSSILSILNYVVEGKSVTYTVRFIEGWTFRDYLGELNSKDNIDHTLAGVEYENILDELGIEPEFPEGWFFPDTYNYTTGQTDAKLLQTSYSAMKRALNEEWENRKSDLPYDTPYEALIVASIIQKESQVESEFPLVSGVIVNRLQQGMRLQMDPTVIYGLGGLDRPLNKSELTKDTPYNTYTRRGLPPTPISMPGGAALRAAVQPTDTSALYFVARGDGTHQFSDTLDEHINAVREYRKTLRQ